MLLLVIQNISMTFSWLVKLFTTMTAVTKLLFSKNLHSAFSRHGWLSAIAADNVVDDDDDDDDNVDIYPRVNHIKQRLHSKEGCSFVMSQTLSPYWWRSSFLGLTGFLLTPIPNKKLLSYHLMGSLLCKYGKMLVFQFFFYFCHSINWLLENFEIVIHQQS